MKINKRAIYSGSFDPPTKGHLWMINQSSILFEELIIGIGLNPNKKYKFLEEERKFMLQSITEKFNNIKIKVIGNKFLVDFAKKTNANYIVRGIRNPEDYEFERKMRYINSDLYSDINTVFLIPPREYVEVSSSVVNSIIGLDGWEKVVDKYLPCEVYKFILNKYK